MADQEHDELYTLDILSRGRKIIQEWSNGKRTKASIAADIGEIREEIRSMIPDAKKSGYGGKGPQVGKGP